MNPTVQITVAFLFGLGFVITLITLATKFPHPTPFQYNVFRVVLSLAAAGIGAIIPGFLVVEMNPSAALLVRGGGALAVFAVVYFRNPATLAARARKQTEGGGWPQVRTLESLSEKLGRISPTSRRILRYVAAENGPPYAAHIAEAFGLGRPEMIFRGKELESQELIEVIQLTDIAFLLHSSVMEAIRKDKQALIKLLGPEAPSAAS